ncbi:MAG: murein hydrolase activator EnvC family protein [Candidatus Eisenbacteria bacterium]
MRVARVTLGVALTLAALSWAPVARTAQEPDSSEMEARRKLEEVKRQARENREQAQKLKGKENQAVGQLRRTEREINVTRRRLQQLRYRRQQLDSQLEVTRADLQRNVQSLSEKRALLSRRLRRMYETGPASELETLLSSGSFAQLLTRWDYLVMVAEQDRLLMEDVRAHKEVVETLEQRLAGHLQQVDRTAKQTNVQNQRLAQQRQQRAETVLEIQTQRQAYEAAAAELERTARALQNLLARLEKQRREEADKAKQQGRPVEPFTGDFARGQGSLDWPLRGDIVGTFGPETHAKYGTTINNDGIDIAAPIGTAVHAVARAKVAYTNEDYASYGEIVILNHGDGYYTLYGHLSEIDVSVGQEIAPGQVIGRSGDSGSIKGAVLHFEVRRGSDALDPRGWLRP